MPAAALRQLAVADAFRPSLGLARREAIWAIDALRDVPLPLFAAASARETQLIAEQQESAVGLRPMTDGKEVVEDYRSLGLSLRQHSVSFRRVDLRTQRYVDCARAGAMGDGRAALVAGIVLVRQRSDPAIR